MPKIWVFLGLAAAIPLIGAVTMGGGSAAPVATAVLAQATTPALSPDDRILGKPDAPVTIIEYASLTCPHCAAFDRETLPKLKAEWIDTGKAKLVFRDFPLDGAALKAAVLARCAPPDKFYGFIDTLFSSQESWGRGGDPTAGLARIAKLGGMNDAQFQACMKNEALQNAVLGMRMVGEKQYHVESTPTFYINGKPLVGALPYEQFETALKAAEPKA
ncbi:MAG: DsbA family protein [Alphaproteobacteria bacterium]|nr:DsbA family protein [Alphaproteobacteria bacterium]